MSTQLTHDEIKLADKCRDFSWIKEQFDKGKLRLVGNSLTPQTFEYFRAAVKLVNDVYEGLWDIDIEVHDSGVINIQGIVIYFPKVHITNSRSKKHDIEDLFMRVVLEPSGSNSIRVRRTLGGRTTFSHAEFSSSYLHSHLHANSVDYNNSSREVPYYDSFCTGSGHINDYIAELNTDGYTDKVFTSYLVQLLSLASWESLEGTPYISIENIFLRDTPAARRSNISEMDKQNYKQSLLNYHRSNSITPCLEFTCIDNYYKIIENEKFDRFLNTIVLSTDQKKKYLCMQDASGTYYQFGTTSNNLQAPALNPNPYIFQGKAIFAKISDYVEKEGEEKVVYFLHPIIKQYLKEELEYDTNQKIIRQSTLDKYSS